MSEVPLYTISAFWGSDRVEERIVDSASQHLVPCSKFRGGIVFTAHRLVCHSTLGLRVIKKKEHVVENSKFPSRPAQHLAPSLPIWAHPFGAPAPRRTQCLAVAG